MDTNTSALEYRAGPIRDYLFPFVSAAAVFLLPFSWIMATFLVIGQAHFLMAYFYQYKGKKMNIRYLICAAILAILAVIYFSLNIGIMPILVVAGIVFSAHFALDEFTLHGEALTPRRIMTIIGFALLFSTLIINVAFPSLSFLASIAGVVLLATIIWRMTTKAVAPPSAAEKYLWLVGVLLVFFAVFMGIPEKVLGIILLLHFANWYVGYGDRLRPHATAARVYWIEVGATLAISLSLFILYVVFHPQILIYVFGLAYFYAWAAAHIVLSFFTATYRMR